MKKTINLSILRLLWLLPLAWIASCFDQGEDVHFLSLNLDSTFSEYQRVRIVVAKPQPSTDTLEVVWNDSLPDLEVLKKLRTRKYKGGSALVVVRAYHREQLIKELLISYDSQTRVSRIDTPVVVDSIPPILESRLPDTITLRSWRQFPDSLVRCHDARDGLLRPILDTLPQDPVPPTMYNTWIWCVDMSDNVADPESVMVWIRPEPETWPVITLSVRDSLEIPVGSVYSGSVSCSDAGDGSLPVKTAGRVKTDSIGAYVLTHSCADKDSNLTVRKQTVWVADTLDTEAPVVTLKGSAFVNHPLGELYVDSGATCMDRRDGERPVEAGGEVDIDVPGLYFWRFKCRDLTGNTHMPNRRIRVGRFTSTYVRADGILDTTAKSKVVNSGMTPVVTFGKRPRYLDSYASFLAFDLSEAGRDSLESARATFQTYISGPFRPDVGPMKLVFVVHRIKTPWVEGTGNWYYYDGLYQNRGHVLLRHHPFNAVVASRSTNGSVLSGITKEQKEILREENMEEAGRDTLTLSYAYENYSNGAPGVIPPRKHLVPIELDLTNYVKETPPGEDHGLVITTEGMPDNIWINWATRELGDGTLGPVLRFYR